MADLSFRRTTETVQEFRKRVLKIQSMVNKRLKRLEQAGLQETKAYQQFLKTSGGAPKFSVKGKSYNELVSQYYQMINFINEKSSTVKGAKDVIKDVAKSIGFTFTKNQFTMTAQLGDFWRIYRTLDDYYQKVEKQARHIDYRKMFNAINNALSINKEAIGGLKNDAVALENIIKSTMSEIEDSFAEDVLDYAVDMLKNEFINRSK